MKKDYGKKYICFQCNCVFYDLGKPLPLCPKCGADQNLAPVHTKKTVTTMAQVSSKRKDIEEEEEPHMGEFGDYLDEVELDAPDAEVDGDFEAEEEE
ncbi:MAG: hypothetical protein A2284_07680 [Deltaproteobacteria bacterium RIFOXYA12_FULL_61_11]|nr:MAG: hypothetical protein A2284_07680 [Deltaproteobacteria bacterium RIFOXYA12_FULL_61_11]